MQGTRKPSITTSVCLHLKSWPFIYVIKNTLYTTRNLVGNPSGRPLRPFGLDFAIRASASWSVQIICNHFIGFIIKLLKVVPKQSNSAGQVQWRKCSVNIAHFRIPVIITITPGAVAPLPNSDGISPFTSASSPKHIVLSTKPNLITLLFRPLSGQAKQFFYFHFIVQFKFTIGEQMYRC